MEVMNRPEAGELGLFSIIAIIRPASFVPRPVSSVHRHAHGHCWTGLRGCGEKVFDSRFPILITRF